MVFFLSTYTFELNKVVNGIVAVNVQIVSALFESDTLKSKKKYPFKTVVWYDLPNYLPTSLE